MCKFSTLFAEVCRENLNRVLVCSECEKVAEHCATLSFLPSFLRPPTLCTYGMNYPYHLSPSLSGYSRSLVTRLFLMAMPMSWPDELRCFCDLSSLVVSFLLPLVSTNLLFWTEGVLSNQIF